MSFHTAYSPSSRCGRTSGAKAGSGGQRADHGHPGAQGHVGVAGGVDHHPGRDRHPARLGLHEQPAHPAVLDDGVGGPHREQRAPPRPPGPSSSPGRRRCRTRRRSCSWASPAGPPGARSAPGGCRPARRRACPRPRCRCPRRRPSPGRCSPGTAEAVDQQRPGALRAAGRRTARRSPPRPRPRPPRRPPAPASPARPPAPDGRLPTSRWPSRHVHCASPRCPWVDVVNVITDRAPGVPHAPPQGQALFVEPRAWARSPRSEDTFARLCSEAAMPGTSLRGRRSARASRWYVADRSSSPRTQARFPAAVSALARTGAPAGAHAGYRRSERLQALARVAAQHPEAPQAPARSPSSASPPSSDQRSRRPQVTVLALQPRQRRPSRGPHSSGSARSARGGSRAAARGARAPTAPAAGRGW